MKVPYLVTELQNHPWTAKSNTTHPQLTKPDETRSPNGIVLGFGCRSAYMAPITRSPSDVSLTWCLRGNSIQKKRNNGAQLLVTLKSNKKRWGSCGAHMQSSSFLSSSFLFLALGQRRGRLRRRATASWERKRVRSKPPSASWSQPSVFPLSPSSRSLGIAVEEAVGRGGRGDNPRPTGRGFDEPRVAASPPLHLPSRHGWGWGGPHLLLPPRHRELFFPSSLVSLLSSLSHAQARQQPIGAPQWPRMGPGMWQQGVNGGEEVCTVVVHGCHPSQVSACCRRHQEGPPPVKLKLG